MPKQEDDNPEPTWRPRSDERSDGRGFEQQPPSTGQTGGAWRNREFYQPGEGYNSIGSDYLRDVGVPETTGRSPHLTAWHTARDPWRHESAAGPHVGRGPKGYVRRDDKIREEVCERLMRHGRIDASDIEVEVQGGEVILQGEVDSRRTKRLAEEILDDVAGVVDVSNRLRVRSADR